MVRMDGAKPAKFIWHAKAVGVRVDMGDRVENGTTKWQN